MLAGSIRELVAALNGEEPLRVGDQDLEPFAAFLAHPDIADYLRNCLPREGYLASGMRICSLERIKEENLGHATPGCYVFGHGYLVIATSVGGNAMCFHAPSGKVYWADHSSFSETAVTVKDPHSGEWVDMEGLTAENVGKAMILLDDRLESFLTELLGGRLEGRLDELD